MIAIKILKIKPFCKSAIWGGERLKERYNKNYPGEKLAETWELSLHPDGPATDEKGILLSDIFADGGLGTNLGDFERFPALTKLIDARDDLSVQVHPSDEYAERVEGSFGKDEMWIIVEAEEGAGIYLGLKSEMTKDEFSDAIEREKLTDMLRFVPVKRGESYLIPSGTLHAIGRGCLIYEIQENSNITYRVYDYGRQDKNGNRRELHVEKAIEVANLTNFVNLNLHIPSYDGEIIGMSRYFHVTKIKVNKEQTIKLDKGSFRHLACVAGSGEIGGTRLELGESAIAAAEDGELILKNTSDKESEFIMTQVRKYYVGIDLGGTFIKGGIVDDLGNIILSDKTPTESAGGSEVVAKNIAGLVASLLLKAGLKNTDVVGVGMGVPGMIDSKAGVVTYSNNLGWKDFPIGKRVSELTGLQVKIANDANVAALGEVKFGGGIGADNVVMLTLGTGVGGGAVVEGRLLEGNKGAGAEFGHSCISVGGELCTCGRRGCLEAYASATALIRDTKRAMQAHPESEMWKVAATLDEVDGETAFKVKDTDDAAGEVVKNYIMMLGEGLVNITAVFRPEIILLGGGVSAQGDTLIKPLQSYVDKHMFAGELGPRVEIKIANLGNRAGLVGAACLLF